MEGKNAANRKGEETVKNTNKHTEEDKHIPDKGGNERIRQDVEGKENTNKMDGRHAEKGKRNKTAEKTDKLEEEEKNQG